METSVILIRHAETVWNREGRMQGFQDSPLSATGREQAARLGRRLRARRFDGVYSSDSGRCRETTRIAFDGVSHDLTVDAGWRERSLGAWEGLTWKEIMAAHADTAGNYRTDPAFRPPDGETWLELRQRTLAGLDKILSAHAGKRVAVFTSGGTLRAAVFGAMNLPAELWATWATWNTGLSRLDHRDGKWKLVKYNDVGHLSGTGDGRAMF